MFDIIAPHKDKLALAVNVKGVHHAEPRLACSPTRRPNAPEEKGAHDQQQHQKKDDDDDRAEHIGRSNTKFLKQGLHHSFHPVGPL